MSVKEKKRNGGLTLHFKDDIISQFNTYEVMRLKMNQRISNRSGFSLQYVRRWFRQKDFYHKEIEAAAWAELKTARSEFEGRQKLREEQLKQDAE